MLKLIFIFLIVFVFISCKKNEDNENDDIIVAPPVELNIESEIWYTDTADYGITVGEVYVVLSGNTNAKKVTIWTYGDGISCECCLNLNNQGCFTDTIKVLFTNQPYDSFYNPKQYSTSVTAYSDSIPEVRGSESCDCWGSGSRKETTITSDSLYFVNNQKEFK